MLVIENRTFDLLQLLLSATNLSLDAAISRLGCTERQIKYDIKKINDMLADDGGANIRIKDHHIVVTDETRERLEQFRPADSGRFIVTGDNKVWLICIMIFCAHQPLGIVDFTTTMNTSRSTVLNDIKKLTTIAAQYRVGIKYTRKLGYHFVGEEKNVRTLILYALTNIKDNYMCKEIISLAVQDRDYHKHNERIHNIVASFIKDNNFPVIKEYQEQSILFISIMHYNCQSHMHRLVNFNENLWPQLPMYSAVAKLYDAISEYIVPEETDYLFVLLISMTLGNDAFFHVYSNEKEILREMSLELTNRFEVVTGSVFPDKAKVAKNIFLHLQPAYFRLKYGIPVINPILLQVKRDYGEVFDICRLVLEPFSDYLDCFIPDNEIAYIAIHFLAMLDSPKLENIRKQAVVVCQNGLASSVMMQSQLMNMFPEMLFNSVCNIEQFYEMDPSKYDVVFTSSKLTVPLGKHVFTVAPVLGKDEKYTLSDLVYSQVFGLQKESVTVSKLVGITAKYSQITDMDGLKAEFARLLSSKYTVERREVPPLLKDLLTKETIHFRDEVSDWEDAVRLSAQPLLDNGSIEEVYVQAMIDNVKEHGPYIVLCPYVAIPHATNKVGVNKLGMSYLKLEKEVLVLGQEDKPVKLLITLAATDSKTHLKALAQLSNILSDTEEREDLVAAATLEEVLSIIEAAEE